jgi:hypothetical protein
MPLDVERGGLPVAPADRPLATLKVADDADAAALLELSNDRDRWRTYVLAMWRAGHAAGAVGEFERGYAAAVADVKAAEHGLVEVVRLACRRSRPGGAAWLAEVERHDGTEHGGVGKPRRPVPTEIIEQARRDLRGVPR